MEEQRKEFSQFLRIERKPSPRHAQNFVSVCVCFVELKKNVKMEQVVLLFPIIFLKHIV